VKGDVRSERRKMKVEFPVLTKGEHTAKVSTSVLIGIGVVELLVGVLVGSIALMADGVHSFADASVSFIVWVGLKLSRRRPDGKFHFGYYKAESFFSMIAAFVMFIIGIAILYESYLTFLNPRTLLSYSLALITILSAGIASLALTIYKIIVTKRLGLLSLRLDLYNSVKDSSASFIVFFGILSSYLGFLWMDAVAGFIIGFLILGVTYMLMKEVSLILMDACSCPEMVGDIRAIAEGVQGVDSVSEVNLRKSGPFIFGEMVVEIDGNLTLHEVDAILDKIEESVKSIFPEMKRLTIEAKPTKKMKKV
jgi:cation diffusion facilitator family transporter